MLDLIFFAVAMEMGSCWISGTLKIAPGGIVLNSRCAAVVQSRSEKSVRSQMNLELLERAAQQLGRGAD